MSPKVRTAYRCTECGAEHAKWAGRCDACGEWNTLTEEIVSKPPVGRAGKAARDKQGPTAVTLPLRDVRGSESPRPASAPRRSCTLR